MAELKAKAIETLKKYLDADVPTEALRDQAHAALRILDIVAVGGAFGK